MIDAIVSCVAIYDFGFALFHIMFWRLFRWPAALAPSGSVNAAITQTLNLMLAFVFATYATGIVLTSNGSHPTFALWAGAGFWMLRFVLQPLMFGLGRRASVVMSVIFVVGVVLHAAAASA